MVLWEVGFGVISTYVPILIPTVTLFVALNNLLDVVKSSFSSLQGITPTSKVAVMIRIFGIVPDRMQVLKKY